MRLCASSRTEARFTQLREDLKVTYQQGDLLLNCVSQMCDGGRGKRNPKKGLFVCCCHDNQECIKRGTQINMSESARMQQRRDGPSEPGCTCTHHAVVVDQLQLVVRQNVAPVVHQVQRHLRGGHARLAAGPAPAHGEQSSDVQLLLSCGRPGPEEEEKGDERQPEDARMSRSTLGN